MSSRHNKHQLLGLAAAARLGARLILPPREAREVTRGLEDIAREADLAWRQAIVLAALEFTPEERKRHPWVKRIYLLRRNRIPAAMRRFEQLGYIEPGWTVGTDGATCVVTNSGRRIGVAVRRVLRLEDYPGEPVRFRPR